MNNASPTTTTPVAPATKPARKGTARGIIRALIPAEIQPPPNLGKKALAAVGFYRFRTWLASHGVPVPDAHLYRPLYSPWEGEATFEPFYQAARPRTLVSRDRCFVLWKTLQQALQLGPGLDVVECGVFRGGTALLEAMTIAGDGSSSAPRSLHLFDSFAGMPEDKTGGDDRFQKGDLGSTSAEAVAAMLRPYPFVKMHVGYIPQTFEGCGIGRVAWAHVDVDMGQAVHDCIEYLYPRLVPGGVMMFDDYGFPSCSLARAAVDNAFAGRPEVPLCLPTGQCMVVKLPPATPAGGAA